MNASLFIKTVSKSSSAIRSAYLAKNPVAKFHDTIAVTEKKVHRARIFEIASNVFFCLTLLCVAFGGVAGLMWMMGVVVSGGHTRSSEEMGMGALRFLLGATLLAISGLGCDVTHRRLMKGTDKLQPFADLIEGLLKKGVNEFISASQKVEDAKRSVEQELRLLARKVVDMEESRASERMLTDARDHFQELHGIFESLGLVEKKKKEFFVS